MVMYGFKDTGGDDWTEFRYGRATSTYDHGPGEGTKWKQDTLTAPGKPTIITLARADGKRVIGLNMGTARRDKEINMLVYRAIIEIEQKQIIEGDCGFKTDVLPKKEGVRGTGKERRA
jgi:hypothetical protein